MWLWLEEKRIPYRVVKITMKCYGEKEQWYKEMVPNGQIPAVTIDGKVFVDSTKIIKKLEGKFGTLNGLDIGDKEVTRAMEMVNEFYAVTVNFVTKPFKSEQEEGRAMDDLFTAVNFLDLDLEFTEKPYFFGDFGTADIMVAPFIERAYALLLYYKDFNIRAEFPGISKWFDAMEARSTYRGT